MLATLAEPAPPPPGWSCEPKLDGVRCLAVVTPDAVQLVSRNGRALGDAYPELVTAMRAACRGSGTFDGEVVAIDEARGLSSFSLLQERMQLRDARRALTSGVVVEYWLFDCLGFRGRDLKPRSLVERRHALERAVRFGGSLRLTPHWPAEREFAARYAAVCRRGGEGLITKRLASPYRAGRSRDWLKMKCVRRQEFVVGGWTEPRGSRERLGALLVGYFDGSGALRYAGKVGTGFDREMLELLAALLAPLARRTSPFAGGAAPDEPAVHWVRPALVAEIAFAEWTHEGHLRHPRFVGLRHDKAASAVRREDHRATVSRPATLTRARTPRRRAL